MPYVSKDDIMAYIGAALSVQAGQPQQVQLILYKDYINNQLNAADADSITVALFNSLGQKMYQYSNPVIAGVTDLLTLGQPATSTQGYITFDITAQQSANLANGAVYVQVTITYSNYYPSAKTYVLPLLQIGSVSGSSSAVVRVVLKILFRQSRVHRQLQALRTLDTTFQPLMDPTQHLSLLRLTLQIQHK